MAAGGFLVTSFRAKSRNLPCPVVIHVSVKMKIDVFVFRFPAVSRRPLWVCQKDPSAALGMTKRGADGFSLVFRSLLSIRFLRCVPLQRVRSGEECPKNCGERSSRIVAEYRGALAAGGFLVTSFRAKSRNLPCPAVIHVSVKMKIDVFVFRFPAVSRRPLWVCQKDPSAALGMTKRGADGFSLVFRSLLSIRFLRCVPLQRVRSGEECPKNYGERSSRIVSITQAGNAAIREYHLLKKAAKPPPHPSPLNPEP